MVYKKLSAGLVGKEDATLKLYVNLADSIVQSQHVGGHTLMINIQYHVYKIFTSVYR